MSIQIIIWVSAFNHRSGISRSYNSSMFNLLRNCQTLFHRIPRLLNISKSGNRCTHTHTRINIGLFLIFPKVKTLKKSINKTFLSHYNVKQRVIIKEVGKYNLRIKNHTLKLFTVLIYIF